MRGEQAQVLKRRARAVNESENENEREEAARGFRMRARGLENNSANEADMLERTIALLVSRRNRAMHARIRCATRWRTGEDCYPTTYIDEPTSHLFIRSLGIKPSHIVVAAVAWRYFGCSRLIVARCEPTDSWTSTLRNPSLLRSACYHQSLSVSSATFSSNSSSQALPSRRRLPRRRAIRQRLLHLLLPLLPPRP